MKFYPDQLPEEVAAIIWQKADHSPLQAVQEMKPGLVKEGARDDTPAVEPVRSSLHKCLQNKGITRFCQQYDILPEPKPELRMRGPSKGFEALYESSDGHYWLHKRSYAPYSDSAVALTETEARVWLKDRFGWWKRFAKLEHCVFDHAE